MVKCDGASIYDPIADQHLTDHLTPLCQKTDNLEAPQASCGVATIDLNKILSPHNPFSRLGPVTEKIISQPACRLRKVIALHLLPIGLYHCFWLHGVQFHTHSPYKRTTSHSPLPTGTSEVAKAGSCPTSFIHSTISLRWEMALSTTSRPRGASRRRICGHHAR